MARSSSSTRAALAHFADLQQALSDHASERLTFFAFDLMYLDGYDLTKAKLVDRKALLAIAAAPSGRRRARRIQFSDGLGRRCARRSTTTRPRWASKASSASASTRPICRRAARPGSRPRRKQVGDFPIVGYTLSPAAARHRRASRSAQWVDGELEYRGKCGTGFSRRPS